jgi:uncharacterized protein YdeI (YjbR/CyaY-like superfamily)
MPRAFRTRDDFRAWLAKNHATEKELIVRCFKVHASVRGIGYREALDEALCYGWIDGVRKSLDKDSFTQRFSPRKTKSKWSNVNIKRFKELQKEGRIAPPGVSAFEVRDQYAGLYSFESQPLELDPAFVKRLRANKKAWTVFDSQPPGRKRLIVYWIMSAKKPETRQRRFEQMFERAAQGKTIGILEPSK